MDSHLDGQSFRCMVGACLDTSSHEVLATIRSLSRFARGGNLSIDQQLVFERM
ncbi:MAG: hypothetical protein ACI9HK_002631 [Pirellulaceae bacterium]|jgi:hypothetical protein